MSSIDMTGSFAIYKGKKYFMEEEYKKDGNTYILCRDKEGKEITIQCIINSQGEDRSATKQ